MARKIEPAILTKYNYRPFIFENGQPAFQNVIKLNCEIIAESDTQYQIRLLQGIQQKGMVVGSLKWVKKRNVDYKARMEYDYTNVFWNN